MQALNELKQKRSDLNAQIKALQHEEAEVTNKIKEIKAQQLPSLLYTIRANPSRSDHCSHTVGIFTTVENAQRLIPHNGKSYDDNCTWHYTIEVRSPHDFDPETVDPPSLRNFPYTGW